MICAVALVLLLDGSRSIQPDQWLLQTGGHADAFESQSIQGAIERGPGIAVTAIAFGMGSRQLVEWRILRTADDARAFAAILRQADQGDDSGTDIGQAIMAGLRALGRAPCQPDEEVVDLVTDGIAQVEPVQRARAYAEVQGVKINAIGVGDPGAADWLRQHAVTPGGFAIQVEDWAAFGPAIRSKITMEVAQR